MRLLVLTSALLLVACQPTIRYKDRIIDRPVPYPVACLQAAPQEPVYETERLSPGVSAGKLIMALNEERKQRAEFTATLLDLLLNCAED